MAAFYYDAHVYEIGVTVENDMTDVEQKHQINAISDAQQRAKVRAAQRKMQADMRRTLKAALTDESRPFSEKQSTPAGLGLMEKFTVSRE
ncbi:MAG: hypothetical protein AAGK74_00160 [Chloroflexota bacterium]